MLDNFNLTNTIFDRFNLTNEEFIDIQITYSIIEPLFAEYLTQAQKRQMRIEVCQKLGIAERTLFQLLKDVREIGPECLVRRVRSDKGKYRKFKPELLEKAKELLLENPARSIQTVMDILKADPETEHLVTDISRGALYINLKKSGFDLNKVRKNHVKSPYRSFEALYCNALWQGDARHGIYLPHPEKPNAVKRTYLFGWVDDYSRKILFAKYYWDEKLPRLEDCLRQAILRWGVPEKIYLDNGGAYISNQFTCIVSAIGIRKTHHPPYQAWCKGKIEAVMKRIKRFQSEAELSGFKTIEELNETLAAWIEVEYNNKVHSSTGETPNKRFHNSLVKYPLKRITNIDSFNANFLWREYRVVNKYGYISLFGNSYKIYNIGIGEKIEARFNPFELSEIYIYHNSKYIDTVKAYKITNKTCPKVPEEIPKTKPQVSRQAQNYFEKLRKKHLEKKREDVFDFSNIVKEA
jgi:transposase InsO family protein